MTEEDLSTVEEVEVETGPRLTAPCPWCDGTGEEIVMWQGHDYVENCGECFGTGEVVELVNGEGLPHALET